MAGKRRDLDAMEKQYDKTSNGASFRLSNVISNIGNAVSNVFGGNNQDGGQDAPAPSGDNRPGSMLDLLTGMTREERIAQRQARRAQAGMGGDGENVVIKGKMTKGGEGGMGFRPHFQGGFAADVQTGATDAAAAAQAAMARVNAAGASFNFPKLGDPDVKKHRISKRQENVKDFFNTIRTISDHSVPKKKSKQEEKTKRQAAKHKFKLDKIKAKKK